MVVNYFISMSIEGYMSVAYFRDGKEAVTNVVSCVCYTSVIVATVLFCVLVLWGNYISDLLSLPKHILFLAILISFFSLYLNLFLDYSRIGEKVIRYGSFSCGNALLNFALSIFLVKYQHFGWEGRVFAQTTCAVLFAAVCLAIFLKIGFIAKPNWQYWKQMLYWGIPLIPHSASNFFRQGCDRYIINAYYDISEVGLFSFALTLCNIIIMVGIGFNQVNSVNIYKILGDKQMESPKKIELLNKQKREEHLKIIIDETDRLTRLVNDMMDLSKIESGIRFELVALCEEIISGFVKKIALAKSLVPSLFKVIHKN